MSQNAARHAQPSLLIILRSRGPQQLMFLTPTGQSISQVQLLKMKVIVFHSLRYCSVGSPNEFVLIFQLPDPGQ